MFGYLEKEIGVHIIRDPITIQLNDKTLNFILHLLVLYFFIVHSMILETYMQLYNFYLVLLQMELIIHLNYFQKHQHETYQHISRT